MTRWVERLIDLAAMLALLTFCYFVKETSPELAGAVVVAAVQFWLQKNAASPDSPAHKEAEAMREAVATRAAAAALAAAEVIKTARTVKEETHGDLGR